MDNLKIAAWAFLVFSLLLIPSLTGCGKEKENGNIYKNSDFGFSFIYPSDYEAKPIKWVKEETGVNLSFDQGVITVQAMPAGTNYEKMPFEQYARIAAVSEIQNYEKLVSISDFSSEYGIKGFKTFWEVVDHEDTDNGAKDSSLVAGPVYYFPPLFSQKLGDQPVKTIMISCYSSSGNDQRLKADTEEIAKSFRYLNLVKSLFKKGHHGKISFVKRGVPFRMELNSKPDTGFNWFITEMDESAFRVESSGYEPLSDARLGTGGTTYFELVPLKAGVQRIGLKYYRVEDGRDKAVDEYRLTMIVI